MYKILQIGRNARFLVVRDAFKDLDAGSKYKKYEYLRMAVETSPLSEEKLAEIREGILKKAKLRNKVLTPKQVCTSTTLFLFFDWWYVCCIIVIAIFVVYHPTLFTF